MEKLKKMKYTRERRKVGRQMNKSKVYFTNLHTQNNDNLQQKLTRLMKCAGMETINFHNVSPETNWRIAIEHGV
ncbi:MAG: hypothetical protein RSB26_00110, partial [Lachnospiraceae bacterium]